MGLFYAYFYAMSKIIIECCANSVQSAINGQSGGADRIELCANLEGGGITPSAASICLAREVLDIDLYVLIRPRIGNFVYSELELEEMLEDIEFCKEVGCEGVVIGALDSEGRVHKKQMQKMIQATNPPLDALDTKASLSRLSKNLSYLGGNPKSLEIVLNRIAKLEKAIAGQAGTQIIKD